MYDNLQIKLILTVFPLGAGDALLSRVRGREMGVRDRRG